MVTVVGKSNLFVYDACCRQCSSNLQYTRADMLEDYSTDYTGGKDFFKYIVCPVCQSRVRVAPRK